MSDVDRRHCRCGWPRPIIAITRATGERPSDEDLVPVYLCPRCGAYYAAAEVAIEDFVDIVRTLQAELERGLKGTRS